MTLPVASAPRPDHRQLTVARLTDEVIAVVPGQLAFLRGTLLGALTDAYNAGRGAPDPAPILLFVRDRLARLLDRPEVWTSSPNALEEQVLLLLELVLFLQTPPGLHDPRQIIVQFGRFIRERLGETATVETLADQLARRQQKELHVPLLARFVDRQLGDYSGLAREE